MSCTPLTKAAKQAWPNQLTRLPCLVVYGKFEFVEKKGRLEYDSRGDYEVSIYNLGYFDME